MIYYSSAFLLNWVNCSIKMAFHAILKSFMAFAKCRLRHNPSSKLRNYISKFFTWSSLLSAISRSFYFRLWVLETLSSPWNTLVEILAPSLYRLKNRVACKKQWNWVSKVLNWTKKTFSVSILHLWKADFFRQQLILSSVKLRLGANGRIKLCAV